jgi:hypothetical protein
VLVADLDDGRHVDGVAVPPVPAPGQLVHRALPGGHLDRRGPVAGGEAVPAAEAGHVADVADDGRGDDRADPGQPGQAGAGRGDGNSELLPGLVQPRVDAPQVTGAWLPESDDTPALPGRRSEAELPAGHGLPGGTGYLRASAPGLPRRALAGLPQQARAGGRAVALPIRASAEGCLISV